MQDGRRYLDLSFCGIGLEVGDYGTFGSTASVFVLTAVHTGVLGGGTIDYYSQIFRFGQSSFVALGVAIFFLFTSAFYELECKEFIVIANSAKCSYEAVNRSVRQFRKAIYISLMETTMDLRVAVS